MTSNTKILLKTKCEGLPKESDFEKIEEEINENPRNFKKILLIKMIKVYLIHRFDLLLEVYHFHRCNDHL